MFMVKNIFVVLSVDDEHKKILQSSAPDANICFVNEKDLEGMDSLNPDFYSVFDCLKFAEIIIGNINPKYLKYCEKLKLLQLGSAGTDGYIDEGVLPSGTILANATGSYGLAISEHMLAMLLCQMKKIDSYKILQQNNTWEDLGPVTSIYGSKTLVVGLGDIGNEFAKRMNALGSTVTGIKRTQAIKPDYVDALYQMDKFYECLKEADIVAACLPNTRDTVKIFDSKAFENMKDGAFFINVGRGNAVDTDALYEALVSNKLRACALDVTDPEPLPKEHKLWGAPNILITPHVSGGYHLKETHNRIVNIAAKNIMHMNNGEAIENIVDMTTGYKKSN